VYRFTEEQLYGGNVPLPLKSAKKENGKVLDYIGSKKVEIVDLCGLVLHCSGSKVSWFGCCRCVLSCSK